MTVQQKSCNYRLDKAEERVNEKTGHLNPSKETKENERKDKEKNTIKRNNLPVIEIPEEEEWEKGV